MTERALPDFAALAQLKGFVPMKTLRRILRLSDSGFRRWYQIPADPARRAMLPPPIKVAQVKGWYASTIMESLNVNPKEMFGKSEKSVSRKVSLNSEEGS